MEVTNKANFSSVKTLNEKHPPKSFKMAENFCTVLYVMIWQSHEVYTAMLKNFHG